MKDLFRSFANATSEATGSPWAFILAVMIIIVWGFSGPIFEFSDTWQLVINTGTTIVTFLMVFLIQNTQNRDAKAMHLKLDELIRGVQGARTNLVDLENMTDDELDQLQAQFQEIRNRVEQGVPEHRALKEAEVATQKLAEAAKAAKDGDESKASDKLGEAEAAKEKLEETTKELEREHSVAR